MVFLIVFVVAWWLRKHPVWELGALGLHVLMDVPTHSYAFFPTPVFWPIAEWKFNGWPWMTLSILVPNFVLLFPLYGWVILRRRE